MHHHIEHFLLQIHPSTDTQRGGGNVKQYLKKLTKLAFKFEIIWVLILKYTESSTPLVDYHTPTGKLTHPLPRLYCSCYDHTWCSTTVSVVLFSIFIIMSTVARWPSFSVYATLYTRYVTFTPADKECLQLNAAYGAFYQALSQFSSAQCVVQTRIVAQEAALPTQVRGHC